MGVVNLSLLYLKVELRMDKPRKLKYTNTQQGLLARGEERRDAVGSWGNGVEHLTKCLPIFYLSPAISRAVQIEWSQPATCLIPLKTSNEQKLHQPDVPPST